MLTPTLDLRSPFRQCVVVPGDDAVVRFVEFESRVRGSSSRVPVPSLYRRTPSNIPGELKPTESGQNVTQPRDRDITAVDGIDAETKSGSHDPR